MQMMDEATCLNTGLDVYPTTRNQASVAKNAIHTRCFSKYVGLGSEGKGIGQGYGNLPGRQAWWIRTKCRVGSHQDSRHA